MTRAMILAAGMGSRLGELSAELPKPLVPICGIPVIRYSLALLEHAGIHDVVVNLFHHGDLIRAELGDETPGGACIRYSQEETLLGTGGGIRRALPLLGDDPFLVMNGKLLIDLDLNSVLRAHRSSGADATLVVRRDAAAAQWGAIAAPRGGGPITGFFVPGEHMFTGIHVLDRRMIERLPTQDPACIVRNGYVPALASGAKIMAFEAEGYFMEHSTPERYLQGNLNALRGQAQAPRWPGPLTGVDATARIHPTARITAPVRIAAGAIIEAGASVGPDVVVGSGAQVTAGADLRETIVWARASATGELRRAIVSREAVVQVP